MSGTNNKITAQQRALLFGASTRQHWQMIGTQEVSGGAQTVSFRVPKSRILSGFRLMVEADINVKGAAGDVAVDSLAPYRVIRRLAVNLNNGFAPVVCSGESAAVLNMFRVHPEIIYPSTNGSSLCTVPEKFTASTAGTSNKFNFMLDIPLVLNDRDPVGMVLAQNQETAIDLEVDICNGGEILNNSAYTVEVNSVKVVAGTITYSIPTNANAFPDMSVLKIWDDRTEVFAGSGQNHIKLPVGMIYRKLIIKLVNEDGSAMTPDQMTGNLELTLNTADIPYSISPAMLRAVNISQLGCPLPDGVYAFDFTYQGISNLGGSRDYIDCERVSEFTLRFTTPGAGKCMIISEKLSRLV